MKRVKVQDKIFVPFIKAEEITKQVKRVASEISADLKGSNPLMVCVLQGAFIFTADLMRELDFDAEVAFTRVKSYIGTQSTGELQTINPLTADIKGRHVVIIEDIVDSGLTTHLLQKEYIARGAADVRIATLFFKPDAIKYGEVPNYFGFSIPSDFIVGYGLDYNEYGRGLKDLYILEETK